MAKAAKKPGDKSREPDKSDPDDFGKDQWGFKLDPRFAKRMEQAADSMPDCPPLHQGRLSWLADQMKTRFKYTVSREAVRRWFAGLGKPREKYAAAIAEILGVDAVWLLHGEHSVFGANLSRGHSHSTNGAVNLVAGLAQIDGATVAFPEKTEDEAWRNIDLHIVIQNTMYDVSVYLGTQTAGVLTFNLPHNRRGLGIGVVKSGFNITLYELSNDAVAKHGRRLSTRMEVTSKTPAKDFRQIKSFAQKL